MVMKINLFSGASVSKTRKAKVKIANKLRNTANYIPEGIDFTC